MRAAQQRKRELLRKIGELLDVPGTITPWPEMILALGSLNNSILAGLEYRIRAARKDAFDDGVAHGKAESHGEG